MFASIILALGLTVIWPAIQWMEALVSVGLIGVALATLCKCAYLC
jgi:hypothetical protein